jgi:hypothetical protein
VEEGSRGEVQERPWACPQRTYAAPPPGLLAAPLRSRHWGEGSGLGAISASREAGGGGLSKMCAATSRKLACNTLHSGLAPPLGQDQEGTSPLNAPGRMPGLPKGATISLRIGAGVGGGVEVAARVGPGVMWRERFFVSWLEHCYLGRWMPFHSVRSAAQLKSAMHAKVGRPCAAVLMAPSGSRCPLGGAGPASHGTGLEVEGGGT